MKNKILNIETVQSIIRDEKCLSCIVVIAASGCMFLATLTIGGLIILSKMSN